MRILKYYLTLILLIFVRISFAGQVDIKTAQNAALNWKNSISISKKGTAVIENSSIETYKGIKTFYTFRFKGGGFVIVSADDNIKPVLAYSDNDVMPADITNETVKWWLNEYNKQIEYVVNTRLENAQSKSEWNNVINNTFNYKGGKSISPLLTTTWDQSCYYNTLCPSDASAPSGYCSHVPTGCVATAMSQIMKYYNFPLTGTGSHTDTDHTYGTLSANFGATTYAWSSMQVPKVTSSNTAVATLMYHCGVAVNMMYAADGSGAYNDDAAYAFRTYFGYTSATYVERSSYSSTSWDALIKGNLDQLMPVYYSGIDVDYGAGHAFVCDGYDNSGNYHFNWGWSGQANGYYSLSSLTPSGTSYNFSSSMMAIVNISPPSTAVPPVADFTASAVSIPTGSAVNFTDKSTNIPTSWQWVFTGATPSASTVKNPQNITYSTAGTYTVSLTAKNQYGSNVKTKSAYIYVYTPGSIPLTVSLGNDTTICSGKNYTLTPLTNGGTPPYTYKWSTGSTAESITVAPGATTTYSVTVSDSKAKTSSDTKVISSGIAPSITQQPVSITTCSGNTVQFALTATGTYLSYKWQYSSDGGTTFNSITTAFSSTYSFNATAAMNTYKYNCVVNSSCNQTVTSNTVSLTVNTPPSITVQPYSVSTCGVKPAQFTIVASGANISYQWYENGAKLSANTLYSGVTTATLKISNVTGLDSRRYNCVISSGICSPATTSSNVYLNVASSCNACDTLNYPLTGTQTTYGTSGGYLTGTNDYGIVDFAQYFPTYPANKVITAVRIAFVDPAGNDNDVAVITIRDNKGTSGAPGNVLATANVTLGIIKQYISNNKYTLINLSAPVTVTTPFYVCAKIPSASGDQVAILSNEIGDNASANAWAYYGSWKPLNQIYSMSSNIDLAISPVLCDKCNALTATINTSGNTSFCQGGQVSLTANSGSFQYQWKKNGSFLNGATTSILKVNSTGTYAVEIKDASSCVAASPPVDITVYSTPVVNLGTDKTITTLQTITLDAGAGFVSYIWSNQATTQKIDINGAIKAPGDYQYSVYVKDNHNCQGADTINIKVVSALCKLSGKVTYANSQKTPLSHITLYLYKLDGTLLDSTITDAGGTYSFSKIAPGDYTIKYNTDKKWSGGDPTDALLINKSFVKLYNFTDTLYTTAADVSNEHIISPLDALMINKRFILLLNSFKIPDWIFMQDTLNISAETQSYNITSVCAGDVNGSYIPASKSLTKIPIVDGGEIQLSDKNDFQIPFYLNQNSLIGAFGFRLKNNNPAFKVIDVTSEAEGLLYNITDNIVNIAWSAIDKSYNYTTDKPLFVLKVIYVGNNQDKRNPIFESDAESVLADFEGRFINNEELIAPHVSFYKNEFVNNFQIYPNPFSSKTRISYTLLNNNNVKISLFDIVGKEIETICNESQTVGNYFIDFDGSKYSQGVYYCKFTIDNDYSKTIKLIINK